MSFRSAAVKLSIERVILSLMFAGLNVVVPLLMAIVPLDPMPSTRQPVDQFQSYSCFFLISCDCYLLAFSVSISIGKMKGRAIRGESRAPRPNEKCSAIDRQKFIMMNNSWTWWYEGAWVVLQLTLHERSGFFTPEVDDIDVEGGFIDAKCDSQHKEERQHGPNVVH